VSASTQSDVAPYFPGGQTVFDKPPVLALRLTRKTNAPCRRLKSYEQKRIVGGEASYCPLKTSQFLASCRPPALSKQHVSHSGCQQIAVEASLANPRNMSVLAQKIMRGPRPVKRHKGTYLARMITLSASWIHRFKRGSGHHPSSEPFHLTKPDRARSPSDRPRARDESSRAPSVHRRRPHSLPLTVWSLSWCFSHSVCVLAGFAQRRLRTSRETTKE